MRIVIDLQGAQSSSSRSRGIGRYTLALVHALLDLDTGHDFIIALNGRFTDTIAPLKAQFASKLPPENLRVWHAPGPFSASDPDNHDRVKLAARIRELFLASLRPDIILVSSHFEGWYDDCATSNTHELRRLPVATILYDLIPFRHPEIYLTDPALHSWYQDKLQDIAQSDCLLAISDASRQEAIDSLGLSPDHVHNISSAVSEQFLPLTLTDAQRIEVLERHGLTHPFVMYTGGIDHRKNLHRLIDAYAQLPAELRDKHQLAIVCAIDETSANKLRTQAARHGLAASRLVLTGFVSDTDLVALYNLCRVFMFPSWHEGFGLPVLEAMRCGAPVLASNLSSLPEVVGNPEALFDPYDTDSMSALLARALDDATFRQALARHGAQYAEHFSWTTTAHATLRQLNSLVTMRASATSSHCPIPLTSHSDKPRLAYVSPLPPTQSGISVYSSQFLPALAEHYTIDVVVDQSAVSDAWIQDNCRILNSAAFLANAKGYDQVLYHLGNSPLHAYMLPLLKQVPGVIVLHDFYVSGYLSFDEMTNSQSSTWSQHLYESHGYAALADRYHQMDLTSAIMTYPANAAILRHALSVIVHSHHARELARQWYGPHADDGWIEIPMPYGLPEIPDRYSARRLLGIPDHAFVVCNFGFVGATKCTARLVDAWLQSPLAQDSNCRLVIVGQNSQDTYGEALQNSVQQANAQGSNIQVTGWIDDAKYKLYLAAADLAVQLRTLSRGETSATTLDALAHGLPTIVNANGSMAELPTDSVYLLPDEFTNTQLADALRELWQNPIRRAALQLEARQTIRHQHDPARCAALFAQALTRQHADPANLPDRRLVSHLALPALEDDAQPAVLWPLAQALNLSFPPRYCLPQCLVDVTHLYGQDGRLSGPESALEELRGLLLLPTREWRVEPVYYCEIAKKFRYARNATLHLLNLHSTVHLVDDIIGVLPGDTWSYLNNTPS